MKQIRVNEASSRSSLFISNNTVTFFWERWNRLPGTESIRQERHPQPVLGARVTSIPHLLSMSSRKNVPVLPVVRVLYPRQKTSVFVHQVVIVRVLLYEVCKIWHLYDVMMFRSWSRVLSTCFLFITRVYCHHDWCTHSTKTVHGTTCSCWVHDRWMSVWIFEAALNCQTSHHNNNFFRPDSS